MKSQALCLPGIKTQEIASRSSSGLGHCPFTAVTGVRVPYGMPYISSKYIKMVFFAEKYAGIAQLVEHNLAKVGVASSNLVSRSTLFMKSQALCLPGIKTQEIVSRSSSGLGHCPFTAVTGVRVPYGMPYIFLRNISKKYAGIAQLVEHNLAKVGVASSNLVSRSTLFMKSQALCLPGIKTQEIVSRSSSGLGHCPFTAVTGVRVPYGMPYIFLRNISKKIRGNSSVGRAQPCQGWGREFESRFPLHSFYEESGFMFARHKDARDCVPFV